MRDPRIVALRRIPSAVVEAFWKRVNGVIGSDSQNALAVRVAKAETIVRAYYVYLMAASYFRITETTAAWVNDRSVQTHLELALSSWLPLGTWREVAVGCAVLMLVASLLAATIPRWRIPRIMAIASFLLLEAMKFDEINKISHASHPLIWLGIAFCFLPSSKNDSSERPREYLASFFGAQVLVCFLYSVAGLSKVIGIAYDWHQGVTWLNPEALPLVLSDHWRLAAYRLAGAFFVSSPLASWLSNVGVLYLEIGTFFAVFRPRLHRPWAFGLLVMHAMVLLTIGIPFWPSAFTVGLILLASPFAPAKLELKETLLDLPIVSFVYQWLRARAAGDDQKEPQKDAAWVPSSKVMKLWVPVLVVVYLCVAFGRLGKQEIYPVSALPMFMRINSTAENVEELNRIRSEIDEHGYSAKARTAAEKREKKERGERGAKAE